MNKKNKNMQIEKNKHKYLFVSVILPIRNESKYIDYSLGAVLAQEYPPECVEILVVDGQSTDDTLVKVEKLRLLHPKHQIRILDNPKGIVSTAMNIGLEQAQGDIIVRVDGHTEIAPTYIQECVRTLQRTGADNVGGRMDPIAENTFGKAVAFATSTPFGIGNSRFHYSNQEEWVDTVYLGAWKRETFNRIGMFDEELVRNQDDEFNYRLRKNGGKILLNPAIRSRYTNRSSPRALWRQYFQYGLWKVRVLQKHPSQMQWRQFVPPIFVLGLLAGGLLGFINFTLLYCWLFLIVLYLTSNLAISLLVSKRKGWQYFPLLFTTFVILHVSYGLGFLWGLAKFAGVWGEIHRSLPATSSLPISK